MPASIPPTAAEFGSRLVLGTAQFGLDYGINNTAGRPADATVHEILRTAQAAGLTLLDTAAAYGDSETRLGNWLHQHGPTVAPFQVVTKLAAGPKAQVQQQLQESLARLQQPTVYGVMFHSFGAFREQEAGWQALREARDKGLVQRIGLSLYHPQEAAWLLDTGLDADLVQVPFNVLDQRFGPLMPEMAGRGVEVHVRSAFLQGLLLRDPATLPDFFAPLAPKLVRLRRLAETGGVPLAALLLQFAAFAPGVGRLVVGVESAANLQENIAAGAFLAPAGQLRAELQALAEETDQFILPYAWPPRT